jgi:hypothetical protein
MEVDMAGPGDALGEWIGGVLDTAGKAFTEVATAPFDAKNWQLGGGSSDRHRQGVEATDEEESSGCSYRSAASDDYDSDDGDYEPPSYSSNDSESDRPTYQPSAKSEPATLSSSPSSVLGTMVKIGAVVLIGALVLSFLSGSDSSSGSSGANK